MNAVSKFALDKNREYQTNQNFRNNINFILTLVSVLIFGIFAIRPSIATISGLIRDLNEYRQLNGVLIEKIAILEEVDENQSELTRERRLAQNALPQTPEEGNYIRTINFLSGKNKVQTSGVTFNTSREDGLGILQFEITIYGPYQNTVNFVSDLNQLLRITSIESISITPENEESSAVRVRINGKTYFYQGQQNSQNEEEEQ